MWILPLLAIVTSAFLRRLHPAKSQPPPQTPPSLFLSSFLLPLFSLFLSLSLAHCAFSWYFFGFDCEKDVSRPPRFPALLVTLSLCLLFQCPLLSRSPSPLTFPPLSLSLPSHSPSSLTFPPLSLSLLPPSSLPLLPSPSPSSLTILALSLSLLSHSASPLTLPPLSLSLLSHTPSSLTLPPLSHFLLSPSSFPLPSLPHSLLSHTPRALRNEITASVSWPIGLCWQVNLSIIL